MKTVFMMIWVYYLPATDTTYMTYGADFSTKVECELFGDLNFSEWIKDNPVSRANFLCVEIVNRSGKTPAPFVDPRTEADK